jgi:hypothetical protein
VLQDLEDASDQQVARERARIATEGWGARLLAAQDDDGGWDGGIYSPKWTSTTYTLLHLLWLGLARGHPAAVRGYERRALLGMTSCSRRGCCLSGQS